MDGLDPGPGGELLPLDDKEKSYIRQVLASCGGNKSRAAKALGISLYSLKRKVKE